MIYNQNNQIYLIYKGGKMLKLSSYEILGLKDNFTYKDIKKAYRQKVRQYPPEQYPKEFMTISDAYETLTKQEYFISNMQNSMFYFDMKVDETKSNQEDFTPYLKKIFEVPFYD